MKLSAKAFPTLESGYAESSTRRHPREPETVIVGESEIREARYIGSAYINGSCAWQCWRVPAKPGRPGRYYFQYRPW
jgi:hypothetical protein